MKTRFTLLISLLVFFTTAFSQWDGYMYWEMRQRFLDKFIRVGEGHGMSIPGSWVRKQGSDNVLVYEDESTRHIGWYLAMLATEHKLLKYYGYPTDQNEREMYYAFKAINRLDGYAEFLYDQEIPVPEDRIIWNENEHKYEKQSGNTAFTDYTNTQLNGFLIREDVPPGFGQLFSPPCTVHHQQNDEKSWIRNDVITGVKKTVMSQDQFFHLMFGLSFVKKYMGGVSYNGMNFVDEAKAFCSRVMINYNASYHLTNPVTGGPVTDLDGDNIGNSSLFAWFVATMANWFVRDVNYSAYLPAQFIQDLTNPFFKGICGWSKTVWWQHAASVYAFHAFSSPNQIMTQLLLCMSNAFNGFPLPTALFLNAPDVLFQNPGYRFYATALRLFHNYPGNIGYSKAEMEEMLGAMDCEGPHWYSRKEIINIEPTDYWPSSQIAEYVAAHSVTPGYYSDVLINDQNKIYAFVISWGDASNPVWNRDNIFAQPPLEYHGDHMFRGHFNGLDFMLLHNIYQLLVIDEAPGFAEDHDGTFIENIGANAFCGGEICELTGVIPAIYQDQEQKLYLDLNPFDEQFWNWSPIESYTQYGAVHQVGTEALPYIRTSTGEIKLGLTVKPLVRNIAETVINTNTDPPVSYTSTPHTYIPKIIIKATKGITFDPDNWDNTYNTYLDLLPAGPNEACYASYYSQRLAEGASRLRYEIFDRRPVTSRPEKPEEDAAVRLFPNPATVRLSILFEGEPQALSSVTIYDASGRVVLTPGISGLQHPDGTYGFSIASLPAGVYSCTLVLEGKVVNRSFVKM